MSKYKLLYLVSLFSIMFVSLPIIHGTTIEINVAEVLDSTIKEMDCCNLQNNLMGAKYDLLNSGSLEYVTKIRFDIYNGSKKLSTIWSKEYILNPGNRETLDLYWHNNVDGTLDVKAKLYRAYDIVDIGNLVWTFNGANNSEETINIENVHVYNDEIQFRVETLNDTKKVIVYPKNSPEGWIFEQNVVENLKSKKSKSTHINYETGIFSEREITLVAVSEDGKNYGEKTIVLKRESDFKKWINQLVNFLSFS